MVRYVTNIEESYEHKIPYCFTCNYCGKENNKSYDITVSVKATASKAIAAREEAGRQHKKQVKESVANTRRKINKYRKRLLQGKNVTDGKVYKIPLNSECEHCGKRQMWNPPQRPVNENDKKFPLLGIIGLICAVTGFIGTFFTVIIMHEANIPVAVKIVFAAILLAGIIILKIDNMRYEREEAAWFKSNLINEPNDPEKLPTVVQ